MNPCGDQFCSQDCDDEQEPDHVAQPAQGQPAKPKEPDPFEFRKFAWREGSQRPEAEHPCKEEIILPAFVTRRRPFECKELIGRGIHHECKILPHTKKMWIQKSCHHHQPECDQQWLALTFAKE